jgi:hypothetical protein
MLRVPQKSPQEREQFSLVSPEQCLEMLRLAPLQIQPNQLLIAQSWLRFLSHKERFLN